MRKQTVSFFLSLLAAGLMISSAALAADTEEGFVSLFNGKDLTGWSVKGGSATYKVEDGAIVGTCVPNTPNNTFLCSDKEYGNFIFKCEFKVIDPGNSGIQFRSHARAEGDGERVFGYQCEIDPSEKFDTARIYDEGRRGFQHGRTWLNDINPEWKAAAEASYKAGEWNEMEIQCVGTSLRTWLNGNPVSKTFDYYDLSGFFGLQIHAGEKGTVAWRNIRIKDLGVSQWQPFFVEKDGKWDIEGAYKFVPECWSFVEKDGVTALWGHHVKSEPKDGLIVSNDNYDNFAAKVTYIINGGNSALYFRAEEVDTTWLLRGYQNEISGDTSEASIWHTAGTPNDPPGRGWLDREDAAKAETRFKLVEALRSTDSWNTVCTCANGDHIMTFLNGFPITDILDPDGEKTGKLGLQLHGGADVDMWFRDFEVIPFTKEMTELIDR